MAAFACDPDDTTRWYENIESVQWRTPRSLVVGSRLELVARFLGRRRPPSGFAKVGAPLVERANAAANQADLRRIKAILER